MFGVQPKKPQGPAQLTGCAVVGRCLGPAVVGAGVFKLQIAAVGEEEDGLGEVGLGAIAGGLGSGCFGEGGHGNV